MVIIRQCASLRSLVIRTIQIFPMLFACNHNFAQSAVSQNLPQHQTSSTAITHYAKTRGETMEIEDKSIKINVDSKENNTTTANAANATNAATVNTENAHKSRKEASKYWSSKNVDELITRADAEYQNGNYVEVYELLNRLKYGSNSDVQWRIARALYKLCKDETFGVAMRLEMIDEAHKLLSNCLRPDCESAESNPRVYKWMAIILDAKCSMKGLEERVKAFTQVRDCLIKAIQLDPSDASSYFILGKWCFDLSTLNTFERWLARALYGPIPDTSFEQAYAYLLRSYEIRQDNYYIPNLYMLGEACYRMRQYFRARYYLKNAVLLVPRSTYEEECLAKSQWLLKRLDVYDLSKETVLFEFPF